MEQKQLEDLILTAMKKVGGKKENDICHYIPAASGGYIHHFTMRKMKTESPQQLADLIVKFIITPSQPQDVTPKPRAARNSRKRRDALTFSKQDLERMLNMARLAGDKEMIRKLTPKQDRQTIRKNLLVSIRNWRYEPELWNLYAELMTCQSNQPSQTAAALALTI
jgi:hypothetical protein